MYQVFQKIKALQIGKKKSLWALVSVELLLFLAGIAGLFGKTKVYEYGREAMQVNFGSQTEEGITADASWGQSGNMVDFNNISLPAGVYQVFLHYQTDTNMANICTVSDDQVGYKLLLTNGETLYSGLDQTDFTMWLLRDTQTLSVHAGFGGQGSLTVTALTIRSTNSLAGMWIFAVLCLSLIVDLFWLYRQYSDAYQVSMQQKNVIFGLIGISILASLPLMTDYIISSGDIVYHLMRIEGIKDGLAAGQFPVRIAPKWQEGYGYASSIFYGETMLYPAALLRLIGFTVLTSYRIWLFSIHLLTAVISWYCFRAIWKDNYTGLAASAIYTLSIYRLYKTYCSGALGETMAMVFLPLLVYGFYRVFTQDIRENSYQRSYIPLTLGFTGLIQSHLLTCELVGGFTILLCLLLWKRVFRKETFLVLLRTVIYSTLLSAWFLVPFLDYMLTGDFVIHHVSGRTIQDRGLFPAHHLLFFFQKGNNVFFKENGMLETDPMSIGSVLMAVLMVWFYLRFVKKDAGLAKEEKNFGRICAGFGILTMVMSLSAFPWDWLQSLNRVTATLISSIQFPHRFLTIATVSLTALFGITLKAVRVGMGKKAVYSYVGGLAVLFLCSSLYLQSSILYSGSPLRIYNSEGMGNGYVAGGEYLPYGTDTGQLTYRPPQTEGDVEIDSYSRDGLTVEVACRNDSGEDGILRLPLLYYKGYRAKDQETGKSLQVADGSNHSVSVIIPSGYQGTVKTAFVSPWYWRAAEAVSVISFLTMAVWLCMPVIASYNRRKKRGRSA